MKNYITLYYENLEVTYCSKSVPDSWEEPGYSEEETIEVNYEYNLEAEEAADFIWDFMDADEYEELFALAGAEENEDEKAFAYLVDNIEEFADQDKWLKKLLEYYEDSAREEWEDNHYSSYARDSEWDYWADYEE
jgi:hypothetical protein